MNNSKFQVPSSKWVQAFELIVALLFLTLGAGAQPSGTRQATDAEVAAGANVRAFVNPRQAQGVGIATNGQTALQVAGQVAGSAILQTNGAGTGTTLTTLTTVGVLTMTGAGAPGTNQPLVRAVDGTVAGVGGTGVMTNNGTTVGFSTKPIFDGGALTNKGDMSGGTNTFASKAEATQIALANGGGGGSGIPTVNGTGTGTILVNPKFPAVTNDFWVSTSGSDANAGNFGAPFATATNAIAAVPAGNASVIHFGPGTFNCGTNQLTMTSNMKLMGAGKFATILLSTAFGATNPHQFILFPPMNGEISDLTVTNNQAAYCLLGGGDDGHVNSFTNTVIRNTAWFGYSDIFATEGNNGPSSMDVYDSYLYTYEDVTISGGTSGGGGDPAGSTNNVMRFHNCEITSNPFNATSTPNGLSSAVGLVWAEGCNIHPIKTNGTIYAIGIVSTGLGYGRLDNCLLAESGTNADSDFHCVKTPKSPYLIINNCRRSDGGPLNGNGYFYDGNGVQVSGTNSVSYGYGYTNAAPNAVAIGNDTATLTFSNGVICGVGVFTGDGSGLTGIGGGSSFPLSSDANFNSHPGTNWSFLGSDQWKLIPDATTHTANLTNVVSAANYAFQSNGTLSLSNLNVPGTVSVGTFQLPFGSSQLMYADGSSNAQPVANAVGVLTNAGSGPPGFSATIPHSTLPTFDITNNWQGTVTTKGLNISVGETNTTLTASALMQSDANRQEISLANGTGFLTNNNLGGFGWFPFASLPGSGASQSPWTGDIDAAGHKLTNGSYFSFTGNSTNGGNLNIGGNTTNAGTFSTTGNSTNFANAYFLGSINGSAASLSNTVAWTHEGTTTNITATFNGTIQTFTVTNGPAIGTNLFFHYAGANGSISYRIVGSAAYNTLAFDYQPKWLTGSNSVMSNGVLVLTSYGGTNATQIEAAMRENQ